MTVFKKIGRINPGDKKLLPHEERVAAIKFTPFKFTARPKPDPSKTLIVSCLSEFGCETLGALYCIPEIKRQHPDAYVIIAGWYGREYLYRHLADEFWELSEESQWLREYALAFHNNSKNLARLEKQLGQHGTVVPSEHVGRLAVGNLCRHCKHFWGQIDGVICCPRCVSTDIQKSLFGAMKYWYPRATRIPDPSPEKMAQAEALLPPRAVGVTARNRTTYGRNLPADYYVRLVALLRAKGYEPVWIGEKQSTLECPVPDVLDMTRRPECRDLELTFAMTKRMAFTVQYWTASTRLAGMMGTPYLIFESPEQVFGPHGQEAYRMSLCTFGPRKLALCNYKNVMDAQDRALDLLGRCIDQMEKGDWSDVIGVVEDPQYVIDQRAGALHRMEVK